MGKQFLREKPKGISKLFFYIRGHEFPQRLSWTLQMALCAILPIAFLVNYPATKTMFPTFPGEALAFVVVTTAGTVGRGFFGFWSGLKIIIVSYIFVILGLAMNVGAHWYTWGIWYVFGTFSIAIFCEFLCLFNTELMFVIGMINHWKGAYYGFSKMAYPYYIERDIALGIAFGLFAALFPIRWYEADRVHARLVDVHQLISASVRDLIEAMLSDSTSEKTLAVVRVRRSCGTSLDILGTLRFHLDYAWCEPSLNRTRRLEARLALTWRLANELKSVLPVIEKGLLGISVQESESALRRAAECFEKGLTTLMQNSQVQLDSLTQRTARLALLEGCSDSELNSSRELSGREQRYAASYITYHIVEMVRHLEVFEEPHMWSFLQCARFVVMVVFRDLRERFALAREVVTLKGRGPDKLKFAFKLSFCMTTMTAYMLNQGYGDPIFGPAQMAFISALDSSFSTYTAFSQCIAYSIGTCVGWGLSSQCTQPYQYALATVFCALISCWFRTGKQFELPAIYSQFASLPAIRNWGSNDIFVTAFMSNMLSIFYYCGINIWVLPTPNWKRLQDNMKENFSLMSIILSEAATARVCFAHPDDADGSVHKARGNIETQGVLLVKAASQPRVAVAPFPTDLVKGAMDAGSRVVTVLSPLSKGWNWVHQVVEKEMELDLLLPFAKDIATEVEDFMHFLSRAIEEPENADALDEMLSESHERISHRVAVFVSGYSSTAEYQKFSSTLEIDTVLCAYSVLPRELNGLWLETQRMVRATIFM